MGKDKFVNRTHVRSQDQAEVMDEIVEKGVCPFCAQHFARFHKGEILYESDRWIVVNSQWPYQNVRVHLILISRDHVETPNDLSDEAWLELLAVIGVVSSMYNIDGGALAMRFGDSNLTGATVHHLHAHLIEPERKEGKESAKVVSFPIG